MTHVSDETLHALLDGRLSEAEIDVVRAHFATCAECAARVAATKEVLAEAGRLVNALEPPAEGGPANPGRPPQTTEPTVLIPYYYTPPPVAPTRARRRVALWAVGLMLGVASAIAIYGPRSEPDEPDSAALPPERDTLASLVADTAAPIRTPPPAIIATATDSARPGAAPSAAPRDTAAPRDSMTVVPPSQPEPRPAAPPPNEAPRQTAAANQREEAPRDIAGERAAMEALDRQKRRVQAAQALATLDATRRAARAESLAVAESLAIAAEEVRADSARTAEAEAASRRAPVRTTDQRAQLSRRIGLDEAQRLLGTPLHVVDGLRAQAIGIIDGRNVPGADPERPVIRVVYALPSGELAFVDQQRLRSSSDAPRTGPGPGGTRRWIADEVVLYVHGTARAEELRDIADRVR